MTVLERTFFLINIQPLFEFELNVSNVTKGTGKLLLQRAIPTLSFI